VTAEEHSARLVRVLQAKGSAKAHPHAARDEKPDQRATKFSRRVRMSTTFPPSIHMCSTACFRLAVCALLLSAAALPARAQTASDATLYRIFLHDGSTIVSYGEFARVGDR